MVLGGCLELGHLLGDDGALLLACDHHLETEDNRGKYKKGQEGGEMG